MFPSVRIPRAEFLRMLRRAEYPVEVIEAIGAQLPDPVDVERDPKILDHYGLSRERLVDRMGGSP